MTSPLVVGVVAAWALVRPRDGEELPSGARTARRLALVALLFFVLVLVFRDPRRTVPAAPLGVVSPVDGRVVEAGLAELTSRVSGETVEVPIADIVDRVATTVEAERVPAGAEPIYR